MQLYGAGVLEADAEVLRHRALLDYAAGLRMQIRQSQMLPEVDSFG